MCEGKGEAGVHEICKCSSYYVNQLYLTGQRGLWGEDQTSCTAAGLLVQGSIQSQTQHQVIGVLVSFFEVLIKQLFSSIIIDEVRKRLYIIAVGSLV